MKRRTPAAEALPDVLISGGGLVGLTMALALARSGLRPLVVDAADLDATIAPAFDGRVSAVASASARMFQALGLWESMAADAGPIREIRVADGASPLFLHFADDQAPDEPLGYMVENRALRRTLLDAARAEPLIDLRAPERMMVEARDLDGVTARLSGGQIVRAPLLLAAEGRNSALRKAAGMRIAQWSYGQTAICTCVDHAEPHGGVAHEIFLPDGPFAILPMAGGQRSAIVWTVPTAKAAPLMSLDEEAFLAEMASRIGAFLGNLHMAAGRWSYPLGFQHAMSYVSRRLALLGDAAHAMHPIAGQGVNMGFRDVAALAEILTEGARLGLDLGSPELLTRYQAWRHADNSMMGAATDILNRLFSNDHPVITLARRLGLGAVQRMPRLKRAFMQQARGVAAGAPKLLSGEAL